MRNIELTCVANNNCSISLSGDGSSKKGSAPASRNGTPEPKVVFKDKKEAIEAVKDLLRDHVRLEVFYCQNN